jgi:hypothetical protein
METCKLVKGTTKRQPRAVCRRLHVALCAGQCSFWHSLLQYRTDLQPLQSRSLLFSSISRVIPHSSHAQILRAARLLGLLFTCGTPSGNDIVYVVPDGRPRSGLACEASPVAMQASVRGMNRSGCKVTAAVRDWCLGCVEPVSPTRWP